MEDFLSCRIRPTYFRYLATAFGSSFIACVYSMIDSAVVGQYYGPDGASSMVVTAPFWSIMLSLGLLMGLGGAVVFSSLRGQGEHNRKLSNEFFTVAMIGCIIFTVLIMVLLFTCEDQILILFGADENVLPIAREYMTCVRWSVPFFVFGQGLIAFLRNDGAPSLATWCVVAGGVFNIVGDFVFTFTLDLGAMGAGIASAGGGVLNIIVLVFHFFSKKNTLHLELPSHFFRQFGKIIVTGFAAFFIDIAGGIITIIFNNQVLKYLGSSHLAVYSVIGSIIMFVQCCSSSVGQASQPMLSVNYGGNKPDRIRKIMWYAIGTAIVFGVIWIVLCESAPNMFVYIFMSPTDEILEIAPAIIRIYSISFILLPFNVFSTYYFQAILRSGVSFLISIARGIVISGILLFVLPLISPSAIWYAMPITEFLVAIFAVIMMVVSARKKPAGTVQTA
ncbi:MAG: multidrug transporter MatE [Clostridia bacterium]|nr:multidrug transporter MatE [Clostridia bacterium]